jgi:putative hydrolase of the HAD superfamily
VSAPRRDRPQGLLVDLDGVLRHFDAGRVAAAERDHGLGAGSILATALGPDLVVPAVTGRWTHERWLEEVALRLADGGDPAAARAAVARWAEDRGEVDAGVLALVRRARAQGRPVGLATNATDRLDDDLALLGLAGEVDAVVNSSVLGVAKPHPEYYRAACAALGLPTEQVILLDDSIRHVAGARDAGLLAHRFTGPADVRYVDAALGLAVKVPGGPLAG